MKKKFLKIQAFAVAAVMTLPFALSACSGDGGNKEESKLIGKFTSSSDTECVLTDDYSLLGSYNYDDKTKDRPYIYTSDIYPLNTVSGESVNYAVSQSLRLKRDYTYEYVYDVMLRKVTQSGNTDLTKLEVNCKGVFTYEAADAFDTVFKVKLAAPSEGEELRYGATIALEGNIYSWKLNSTANYRLDAATDEEGNGVDRYLSERSVLVERGEERVLYDDIFYGDILGDIAPFCNYTMTSGDEEEPPIQPEPEEKEDCGLLLPAVRCGGAEVALKLEATPVIVVNGEDNKRIDYGEINGDINLSAGGENITFNPKQYLESLIYTDSNASLERKALTATAISVLNAANAELTAEQSALLYDSLGNNLYHSDWGARDNMTFTESDKNAEGFGWDGLPELCGENGAALKYYFHLNEGEYLNLSAVYTVGGAEYFATVEKIKDENGISYYSATTNLIPVLLYDESVVLKIFDNGDMQVSGGAGYSVTRAIAKADLSESETVKATAKTLYSLGKSAAWYARRDSAVYTYAPPVNSANGTYRLVLGAYTYDDARMSYTLDALTGLGSYLYAGNTVTDDNNMETLGDGFTVIKRSGTFFVTVGNTQIDGIRPSLGAEENIVISASGTSKIRHILGANFGEDETAAVKSYKNLTLTGKEGAVLNIYGNVRAFGDITVENVTVNVYSQADKTAVKCNNLTVKSGALNIKYTGKTVSASSGVVCGDITLGGTLGSEGFGYGIWLNESSEGITVNGGGLKVNAVKTGVRGADGDVNKQLVFNGGESFVRAGSGFERCDITVGAGALTAVADNGYTVSSENSPATVRTVSGDEKVGSLSLINNTPYNPYWDAYYTVKADNLHLNGGKVYTYGTSKNGVIYTVKGSVFSFENCDLTVESANFGRGINAAAGEEIITVSNSAKVIFKNCEVAINCWRAVTEQSPNVKLVNYGLIICDGYAVNIYGIKYENDLMINWEMTHTVEDKGQIRYFNAK